jgi:FkbM family methyltransferase
MNLLPDGLPAIPVHAGNWPGAGWDKRLFTAYNIRRVLDVGANIGGWIPTWLGNGAEIVHAMEPIPEVYQTLAATYRNDPRVVTHCLGANDAPVTLHDQNVYNTWTILPNHATRQQTKGLDPALEFKDRPSFDVELISIDDFLRGHAFRPDFIKIDTDGYDAKALRGARRYLAETRPVMMVEISYLPRSFGDDCEAMIRDLFDVGYVLTNINGGKRYTRTADFMKDYPWHTSWDAICEPV